VLFVLMFLLKTVFFTVVCCRKSPDIFHYEWQCRQCIWGCSGRRWN